MPNYLITETKNDNKTICVESLAIAVRLASKNRMFKDSVLKIYDSSSMLLLATKKGSENWENDLILS